MTVRPCRTPQLLRRDTAALLELPSLARLVRPSRTARPKQGAEPLTRPSKPSKSTTALPLASELTSASLTAPTASYAVGVMPLTERPPSCLSLGQDRPT